MKSIVRNVLVVLCVISLVTALATAQDLQQQLSKMGSEFAKGYTSPLLSGFGNDLNSAIYYSADLHDILGFDLGVKVAMSKFTDDDKTYNLQIPSMEVAPSVLGLSYITVNNQTISLAGAKIKLTSGTNYPSSIKGNTAVGASDSMVVKTVPNSQVTIVSSNPLLNNRTINLPAQAIPFLYLPGGFDLGSLGVPLIMPQLNVGLPFGLEAMLRYVPTISAGDAGKFNYMGFGVRYDIDQWIPMFPIDIAVHFMTQKMNFKSGDDKDVFSASATAYGVEISKKLLILTLYGGFQLEKSTLTIADYIYQGNDPLLQGTKIPGFDVEGANKSRVTVGARLLLLIVNAHVEYSIAKNPVIALGVGISLR